ncbi:MAG TPA: EAL domain-containing protein, partial [Gammaproteobacteria bacterium]|nr:EAL domain-containing protein [Gammaproteobacteria bacterium]
MESQFKNPFHRVHEAPAQARVEHRLNGLLEALGEPVCFKDGAGRWRYCNDTLLAMLQLTGQGYAGKTGQELRGLVPPGHHGLLQAFCRGDDEAWDRDGPSKTRAPVKTPSGRRVLEITRMPIRGPESERLELAVFGRDVTTEQRQRNELQALGTAFEIAEEAVFFTSNSLRLQTANAAFLSLTGYRADTLRGRNTAELLSRGYEAWFLHYVREELRGRGKWEGDLWCRRDDDSVFPGRVRLQAVKDDNGRIVGYAGTLVDTTRGDPTMPPSRRKDNYDPLTALPNRTLFHERLGQEVVRARRSNSRLAVLFVDLDFFKEVNDTMGHQAGDSLLREAARRLREEVRETDTVSRLGGDEFTVLLPDLADADHAGPIAEAIIDSLSRPFELEESEVVISASVGIALVPDDATSTEKLLRAADLAMYQAKHSGRGRYAFFEERLNVRAQKRAGLEKSMERAIEEEQFLLHYQPQFDLHTGEVAAVEAFMRWNHPEQGLLVPDQFLSVAEETGLIGPIGDWLIRTALEHYREWTQAGMAPPILSLNLCPRQVRDRALMERVQGAVRATGIAPENLQFDLEEAVFMKEVPNVSETLKNLRGLGVHLGIDDFGTTGGRLERVLATPLIDTIKVDRRFIQCIGGPNPMADGIVALGQATGKQVVAAGVETALQMRHLQERDCRFMQGN